jgi:hypothetical protein
MKQTKEQKAIDKRVEAAYYRTCSGIQINIMDIGKVFAVGRDALAKGVDEPGLEHVIREFVDTIRHN